MGLDLGFLAALAVVAAGLGESGLGGAGGAARASGRRLGAGGRAGAGRAGAGDPGAGGGGRLDAGRAGRAGVRGPDRGGGPGWRGSVAAARAIRCAADDGWFGGWLRGLGCGPGGDLAHGAGAGDGWRCPVLPPASPQGLLARRGATFEPDLHETIYPLATEMLYAAALASRGPVACRLVQWLLGVVFALVVAALARPGLGDRRAGWAGLIALLAPAVSNGMAAPLNDVALAALGNAAILGWVRWRDRPSIRSASLAGVLLGLAIGVKYPALVLGGAACGSASSSSARPNPDPAPGGACGWCSAWWPWRSAGRGISGRTWRRATRSSRSIARCSAGRGSTRCWTRSSGRWR